MNNFISCCKLFLIFSDILRGSSCREICYPMSPRAGKMNRQKVAWTILHCTVGCCSALLFEVCLLSNRAFGSVVKRRDLCSLNSEFPSLNGEICPYLSRL